MQQMMGDMDGPTIEELVDTQLSEDTEENMFKKEFHGIQNECKLISSDPDFLKDSGKMKEVLHVLQKAINKWEEDEEDQDRSIPLRLEAIEKFKARKASFNDKIRRLEQDYFVRKERREFDRSSVVEVQRRASNVRDTDITGRSNATGLYHHSQQGSSSHRARDDSSDEEFENHPRLENHRRDRYRKTSPTRAYNQSSRTYNQSSMYQQRRRDVSPTQHRRDVSPTQHRRDVSPTQHRRDASPNLHRSQHTMNGSTSLQQVRMRFGKSRVTKTTARKYRPGHRALAEIRQYQKSTDLLIQKAPFARLVHEIMREVAPFSGEFRVRADALLALQEGAEAFMVEMFEGSALICNHAKRITLMPTDIQLYRRLCLRNL